MNSRRAWAHMEEETPSLEDVFYGAWGGPRCGSGAEASLDTALQTFAAQARAAHPEVPLEAEAFVAHLGRRAPADVAPRAWLDELRAGDLFLACACAEGLPEALRAFEAAFLGKIDLYLSGLRPTPELVAETRQALLVRLFIASDGKPPRITQYGGRGALGGWVRVTAVRTALNLIEGQKAGPRPADEAEILARAIAPEDDPDLAILRARYADHFTASLREAIAALDRRDRALLRLTFVERVTPGQIGVMHGVHRTTAMRWIDAAQAEILDQTRALLMRRLRLSPSECDELLALVKSRLELSLATLLRTPA